MDCPSPVKIESGARLLDLDLNIYYSGSEACRPGHKWGPLVRDHFVLHAVESGEGSFESGSKTWELGPGSCFLIRPGVKAAYRASEERPWAYIWTGFNGAKADSIACAAGLGSAKPVIDAKEAFPELLKSFAALKEAGKLQGSARQLAETATLYGVFSVLAKAAGHQKEEAQVSRKELHVQKAIEFLERNHSRELSVDELARHVGIDRTHLAHVFKLVMNSSPSGCLLALRVKKSCELLASRPDLSVKEVAFSVGYRDPLLFSKTFRRLKGMPPAEFRRRSMEA